MTDIASFLLWGSIGLLILAVILFFVLKIPHCWNMVMGIPIKSTKDSNKKKKLRKKEIEPPKSRIKKTQSQKNHIEREENMSFDERVPKNVEIKKQVQERSTSFVNQSYKNGQMNLDQAVKEEGNTETLPLQNTEVLPASLLPQQTDVEKDQDKTLLLNEEAFVLIQDIVYIQEENNEQH